MVACKKPEVPKAIDENENEGAQLGGKICRQLVKDTDGQIGMEGETTHGEITCNTDSPPASACKEKGGGSPPQAVVEVTSYTNSGRHGDAVASSFSAHVSSTLIGSGTHADAACDSSTLPENFP